jgi:hypothetical protein
VLAYVYRYYTTSRRKCQEKCIFRILPNESSFHPQEVRHRKIPFVEELKRLLDKNGVKYDGLGGSSGVVSRSIGMKRGGHVCQMRTPHRCSIRLTITRGLSPTGCWNTIEPLHPRIFNNVNAD